MARILLTKSLSRRSVLGAPLAAAAWSIVLHHESGQGSTPQAGEWESAAPLRPARSEYAAAVLDGMIYVAGGFGALARFERFDPRADAWERRADLPEPRHHLSLAALDGAVYLAGGHTESTHSATDRVWRYDPDADEWETLEPLPQGPRGALGAAAIDGLLYVAGGSSGDLSGPATADLARYDPAAAHWDMLAPMPTAREHLAVAAAGGLLVTIGGRDGSHEDPDLLSATEVYDPVVDRWAARAALPVPRAGMGVASDGGAVVVLGGERFTGDAPLSLDAVNRYDVATDEWSALAPLPVGRHGLAAAIVAGTLYAISGSTLAGGIENVERVDTFML
jgi:N-acetylneuraminic acid mutarotase